jgi:hypothetical protein
MKRKIGFDVEDSLLMRRRLLMRGCFEARPFASEQCLCGSEVERNASLLFLCDFSSRNLRYDWMCIFLIRHSRGKMWLKSLTLGGGEGANRQDTAF